MSQTVASVLIQLLTIVLPIMGVRVGSDELTSAVQTVVVVVAGIYIWVRRYQEGDINIAGLRR